MMPRPLYAFLLLMIWCVPTWSQTTTISIGGVDVRLGMTKKQAQEKFPPELYMDNWNGDFVVLARKVGKSPAEPSGFQNIGSLVFANDRLVRAFKHWETSTNNECTKVARGLFNSLVAMNKSRAVPATVVAYSRIEPNLKTDFIDIMFGNRTIRVLIDKGQVASIRVNEVNIEEVIQR